MAKSKKGKKKTKKNSNYKNEVIKKNVPKKSEKNQNKLEHKAKIKEKQKKKEEKLAKNNLKKEEKSSKKDVKNKVNKSEKEENKKASNEQVKEAVFPAEEISEELSPIIEAEEIAEQKSNIIIEKVTNNDVEHKSKKEKKNIFAKFDFKKIKLTKKNIAVLLVAIVTLVALISVISVLHIGKTDYSPSIYSGKDFEDSEVGVISISDEKQSELVKKTDASGNTGKFSFYANTVMSLASPDSALPITLSNPTTSDKMLLCTIVNDNGVIVYRSLGIAPGRFLNKVKLSQYLDYGKNELTLYVSAFKTSEAGTELTYKKVGTQRVKLEVNVGTDYAPE